MGHKIEDRDHGYKALLRRLTGAQASLTVGIHEAEGSATAVSGDGGAVAGDVTIVQVAAFHEFGTSRTPRRSFIADWADENEGEHRSQLRKMAKAVVDGTVASAEQALQRLGNLYVGEVQRRMSQGIDPPLAESTIARKGSSKPLIDTGQLRSSVRFIVK